MLFTHVWRGESRKGYRFRVTLTHGGLPHETAGIYIMVRRRFVFFLQALYIGKAADLRSRIMSHERWPEAWWKGATERHIMPVRTETDRQFIEEDLIRRYKPPLNDMLVPRSDDDGPIHVRKKRGWFG